MAEHFGVYIDQKWAKGSGAPFTSYNPATGASLWHGQAASSAEVEAAIRSAQAALPSWANRTVKERFGYLEAFTEHVRNSKNHLAETISKETGKPLWDSAGEVDAMIHKTKISFEAYEKRCPEMTRDLSYYQSITRHRPHGTVAVFGPYNFPGHLPNGHIIPALLAGNTIVFKPSELTPLTAEATLLLWEKVDLPTGVLNLVQGGRETGQVLIHHPDIQGLFFTGSYPTGQYLSSLFGQHPEKMLALEMGGNNPLIIGEIDDLQAAAYLIFQSAFLSSGQRCTCARRLIVPDSPLTEKLLQILIDMIRHVTIGCYDQKPEPFMGPLITEKHAEHILLAQEQLLAKGGQSLILSKQLPQGKAFLSPGLMDVTPIREKPDEEIFGPFLQVTRTEDFDQAIDEANRTKFGLTAGLISRNPKEYAQFYQRIHAGVVNWNAPLTGASSAAPFGGIKCSGNHRPSAYYAADYCSYPVASLETPEIQMPTVLPPGMHMRS